jgi:hypothetical protein
MKVFGDLLSVRSTALTLCLAGSGALQAQTTNKYVHIRQANSADDGKHISRTEIIVDGPSTVGYTRVENEALDIWVAVHFDKSPSAPKYHSLLLQAELIEMKGEVTAATRRYKFTIPYADPGTYRFAAQSPVAACNDRLASLSGSARSAFLREGDEISMTGAYRVKAVAAYHTTKPRGSPSTLTRLSQ